MDYELVLSSDDAKYGGQELAAHMTYPVKKFDGQNYVELYIPARTAMVLKECKVVVKEEAKAEAKPKK